MGKSEMKCSRCGCKVFHENELDKLECANKTDGPMKEKAKAAFEKLNRTEYFGDEIDIYLSGAQWAWDEFVGNLDQVVGKSSTRYLDKIEKLQAELEEQKRISNDQFCKAIDAMEREKKLREMYIELWSSYDAVSGEERARQCLAEIDNNNR